MKWEVISIPEIEYDVNTAIEGDIYWQHNGRLVFVSNAIENPRKRTLFERIRIFFWRKRYCGGVSLNRRTLEYIYNVCKGVMPGEKEQFIECVMSAIPERFKL